MAGPMADLIRKHGGEPVEAPALREVPIGSNPQAVAFARGLIAGEFDVVVFLTGVGARFLLQEIEATIPREDFFDALDRATVVVRGPKPLAVLREWKVRVDVQVPEPNTWRDLVAALDARGPIAGLRVAVQEYGKPSPELFAALSDRGAIVTTSPSTAGTCPRTPALLRDAARAIAEGRIDAALFTSAQQVEHLLQVADEERRRAEPLREALRTRVLVGSIGPTTTEALARTAWNRRFEPEHPKMGHLVAALAEAVRRSASRPAAEPPARPVDDRRPDPLHDSPFLKACRREPTDVTPVWLMRQAGRYMAEYREVRAKVSFLELCKNPELATEVTVTAAERLGWTRRSSSPTSS